MLEPISALNAILLGIADTSDLILKEIDGNTLEEKNDGSGLLSSEPKNRRMLHFIKRKAKENSANNKILKEKKAQQQSAFVKVDMAQYALKAVYSLGEDSAKTCTLLALAIGLGLIIYNRNGTANSSSSIDNSSTSSNRAPIVSTNHSIQEALDRGHSVTGAD